MKIKGKPYRAVLKTTEGLVQHHLGYSDRFSVNRKYSIFKKLGVGLESTAPNARRLQAESRWATYKESLRATRHIWFCRHTEPTLKNQKSLFFANAEQS